MSNIKFYSKFDNLQYVNKQNSKNDNINNTNITNNNKPLYNIDLFLGVKEQFEKDRLNKKPESIYLKFYNENTRKEILKSQSISENQKDFHAENLLHIKEQQAKNKIRNKKEKDIIISDEDNLDNKLYLKEIERYNENLKFGWMKESLKDKLKNEILKNIEKKMKNDIDINKKIKDNYYDDNNENQNDDFINDFSTIPSMFLFNNSEHKENKKIKRFNTINVAKTKETEESIKEFNDICKKIKNVNKRNINKKKDKIKQAKTLSNISFKDTQKIKNESFSDRKLKAKQIKCKKIEEKINEQLSENQISTAKNYLIKVENLLKRINSNIEKVNELSIKNRYDDFESDIIFNNTSTI